MTPLLFGISASDPVTFAGASLASVVLGVTACVLPASRAAGVNPVVAFWDD
jgi:ABC-type antimicrobial peptide transport system permease subunit